MTFAFSSVVILLLYEVNIANIFLAKTLEIMDFISGNWIKIYTHESEDEVNRPPKSLIFNLVFKLVLKAVYSTVYIYI